MSKQCCGIPAVYVDNVPGKEFFYCRQCKNEVLDTPSRLGYAPYDPNPITVDAIAAKATAISPYIIGNHPYALGDIVCRRYSPRYTIIYIDYHLNEVVLKSESGKELSWTFDEVLKFFIPFNPIGPIP